MPLNFSLFTDTRYFKGMMDTPLSLDPKTSIPTHGQTWNTWTRLEEVSKGFLNFIGRIPCICWDYNWLYNMEFIILAILISWFSYVKPILYFKIIFIHALFAISLYLARFSLLIGMVCLGTWRYIFFWKFICKKNF